MPPTPPASASNARSTSSQRAAVDVPPAARRAPTSRCRWRARGRLAGRSHQTIHCVSRSACFAPGPTCTCRSPCSPGPCRADAANRRREAASGGSAPSVHRVGDEEWAGLREFRNGDSPRQVAWACVRARPRIAGEDLSIAGGASPDVRPRPRAGQRRRAAPRTTVGVDRGGPRARRALRPAARRARAAARQRQRTSRALPQRPGAATAAGEAMVNAAARAHIAATLVFVASVLLVCGSAPLWCVVIATGCGGVAPAGRQRPTSSGPSRDRGTRFLLGAVTAVLVVAVAVEFPHAQRPRGRHRAAAGDGRTQAARGALAPRRRHRGRRGAVPAARRGARRPVAVARAALSTGRVGRLRGDRAHRHPRRRADAARRAAAVGARTGHGHAAGGRLFPVLPAIRRAVLGAAARRQATTGLSGRNVTGQHRQARHRIRSGLSRALRGRAAAASRAVFARPGAQRLRRLHLAPRADRSTTPATQLDMLGEPVRYRVTLEPTNRRWLFALDTVAASPRRDVFMSPTTGSSSAMRRRSPAS